jgi:GNAT superfamily N-acetyltransferase
LGFAEASEQRRERAVRIDPACASTVAALEDDPFYRAICAEYERDAVRRREVLTQYFAYSIQEGEEIGRCVHLADVAVGVAVWLLPQKAETQSRAAQKRSAFLEATLDAEGYANYYRIVQFMSGKAAGVVGVDAWYLSIVAVAPTAQGQGLGRKLLEPTLAEADRKSARCYLETFSPRNLSFYERLGFVKRARIVEPTTCAEYAVMVRDPQVVTENAATESKVR